MRSARFLRRRRDSCHRRETRADPHRGSAGGPMVVARPVVVQAGEAIVLPPRELERIREPRIRRCRRAEGVVGVLGRPRSMPTNARMVGESYSASSTAGSDRLNHCWRKYIRSMRSRPTGGRPLPAWGYTGSMRAQRSRQGTTRSISARNWARRVTFVYFSKPVLVSVSRERIIATSRARVMVLAPSQHNTHERERLIQRFLRLRSQWQGSPKPARRQGHSLQKRWLPPNLGVSWPPK